MREDFEIDPAALEREALEQAMAEDGFTSVRRFLPTSRQAGEAA
jgi:hypothetical protein